MTPETIQRDGETYVHKELTCLVCLSDRDVEVTVDNTADKYEHENEHGHSCWSEDWTGHWRKAEE